MKDFELWHVDCLEEMGRIADGSVDMVLCDPPYGTTQCKWDAVIPFAPMWAELKRVVKPNGAIVLHAAQPFTSALIMSNQKMFKQALVWKKNIASNFLNANRMHLARHEDICLFYSRPPVFNKQLGAGKQYVNKRNGKDDSGECYGDVSVRTDTVNDGVRNPISVLEFDRETGMHPTQKPVGLAEYLLSTYTNPGDTVLDFASGSLTTGIACVNLKRKFIGIEKDEKYFNIGVNRLKEHVECHGLKIELETGSVG